MTSKSATSSALHPSLNKKKPKSKDHEDQPGRKLWKTSRERERLKARFKIQSRVSSKSVCLSSIGDDYKIDEGKVILNNIEPYFRSIENGKCSAFGIRKLADLPTSSFLDALHDTTYLDQERVKLLCVSRFGPLYAEHAKFYLDFLGNPDTFQSNSSRFKSGCELSVHSGISIVTYAALLGQYQVLASILLGGANPIHPPLATTTESTQRYQNTSSRALKRFFTFFPITFKLGIVRRIVEMRLLGFLYLFNDMIPTMSHDKNDYYDFEKHSFGQNNEKQEIYKCQICNKNLSDIDSPILCWGIDCEHIFCEYCCWEDILNNIDERDSIACPVCQADRPTLKTPLPSNFRCKTISENAFDLMKQTPFLLSQRKNPYERKKQSLTKFQQLPLNSAVLKKLYPQNRRKCPRNQIHFSWSESVHLSLGRSQDVRRDKFFTFVEANSIPHVRGCLEAGVNVDEANIEYHQTNLYIASWMGRLDMVALLLDYGADPTILANGGLSCVNVAEENGFFVIADLIRHYQMHTNLASSYSSTKVRDRFSCCYRDSEDKKREVHLSPQYLSTSPTTRILINVNSSHPGVGSCYIDNAITQPDIDTLLKLWRELPIEQGRAKSKEKEKLCAVRSYFCDAEGYLCDLLAAYISPETCLSEIQEQHSLKPVVLSHMRFLYYKESGSSLPPHVDLNRLDRRYNKRSTHTFLLYLTECEKGGETILLEDVAGEGRDITLAKIKPVSGRLLLFPHSCPHEGAVVEDVPKLLLRGEVMFVDKNEII